MIAWPDSPAPLPAAPAAPLPRTSRPRFPWEAETDAAPVSRFALPDGAPLVLTMVRKSLFCSLTDSFAPVSLEHALLLLWLCRPEFDSRARWITPAPADTAEPDLRATAPDYFTRLRLEADAWADTLPHTWMERVIELAVNIWTDAHETAVEPLHTGDTAQKKTPEPSLTGLNPPPAFWPAEPPIETGSSTTAPSGMSTPPSTLGTSPTAFPPSPPLSETGD